MTPPSLSALGEWAELPFFAADWPRIAEQLAAEASVEAATPARQMAALDASSMTDANGELPAAPAETAEVGLDTYGSASDAPPVNFAEAFVDNTPEAATLAPVRTDTMAFVSSPLVQQAPARQSAERAASPRPAARPAASPAARPAARATADEAGTLAAATMASTGPVADGSHLAAPLRVDGSTVPASTHGAWRSIDLFF